MARSSVSLGFAGDYADPKWLLACFCKPIQRSGPRFPAENYLLGIGQIRFSLFAAIAQVPECCAMRLAADGPV